MRSKLALLVVATVLGVCGPGRSMAFASGDARPGRCALGWHFYCDDSKPRVPTTLPAAPSVPAAKKPEDQRAALKAVQDELARLKANMVMDPTPGNVQAYIAFQRQQLDRASLVSDVWRRAIWQHPGLDYTLQRPVDAIGKRTWIDQRNADRAWVMAHLSERYGLFFVFRSDCPFCHAMAPVVRAFAKKYGVAVMAISANGRGLPGWPNFVADAGQLERLGMADKPVPALVLWDNLRKVPIAVGFGAMSQEQIEDRIYDEVAVEVGHDY